MSQRADVDETRVKFMIGARIREPGKEVNRFAILGVRLEVVGGYGIQLKS